MLAGRLALGGDEGELDIVAASPTTPHLLLIACSVDALPDDKRQQRFARKFYCGRRQVPDVLAQFVDLEQLDQVVLLQQASGRGRNYEGGRLVAVQEFLAEVRIGLAGTSPVPSAVPSNGLLLRTLQMAFHKFPKPSCDHQVVRLARCEPHSQ